MLPLPLVLVEGRGDHFKIPRVRELMGQRRDHRLTEVLPRGLALVEFGEVVGGEDEALLAVLSQRRGVNFPRVGLNSEGGDGGGGESVRVSGGGLLLVSLAADDTVVVVVVERLLGELRALSVNVEGNGKVVDYSAPTELAGLAVVGRVEGHLSAVGPSDGDRDDNAPAIIAVDALGANHNRPAVGRDVRLVCWENVGRPELLQAVVEEAEAVVFGEDGDELLAVLPLAHHVRVILIPLFAALAEEVVAKVESFALLVHLDLELLLKLLTLLLILLLLVGDGADAAQTGALLVFDEWVQIAGGGRDD